MTSLYKINTTMAREKEIPVYFIGTKLIETKKAVYLYGHGTTETKKIGVCSHCGRTLTHPVSVLLGIGPECGSHYYSCPYSKEYIDQMTRKIQEKIIDTWLPKSCVTEIEEVEEEIQIPKNHPMTQKKEKQQEKKKQVFLSGNMLVIEFPFNTSTLTKVKTLTGRKYDPTTKRWSCPFSMEAVEKLITWEFVLDSDIQEKHKRAKVTVEDVKEIQIPGLNVDLLPFQKKGVSFLEVKQGKAIIADAMGLGKTIQALAWLQLHPEIRPAIVVCKASAKWNWERELRTKMDGKDRIQVISGKDFDNTPLTGSIIVLNYDILGNKYIKKDNKLVEIEHTGWVDYLKQYKPKSVIIDECHCIKNNKALRTKGVKKLAKGTKHVIPMSGTPFINRPIEMFNAIKLVAPQFMNWMQYTGRYCDRKSNGFGWDVNGSSNKEELHEKLKTLMIRRTKEEVIKDLPPKTRSFVPLEIPINDPYWQAENDFISWLEREYGREKASKAKNAEALVKIGALKKLAAQAKIEQATEWIKDFLESGEKIVLFAQHKDIINHLMKEFGNIAVKIDGSVPVNQRQKIVDQFQNDPDTRIFIGNIQAAGDSITLTKATSVAFLELPWTPGEVNQCEDRVYARLNDLHGAMIYFLLAAGTIDETTAEVIDKKQGDLDAILDGKETEETNLISEIMKKYGGKNK